MKKKIVIYFFVFLLSFAFAKNVDATPVHKDIKDDVFYSVIIENLNSRNVFGKNDREVNYIVTDEELNTITYLKIDGHQHNIEDFQGLNKLKSLRTLVLEYYLSLSKLDISQNKELTYLRVLNANSLHDIDFSNNTKLLTIDLTYTHLNSLDLKNCVELRELRVGAGGISESRLKYLDVSNCLKLNSIAITGHHLESVDLSNNTNLSSVSIAFGDLKKIILPQNSNISTLGLIVNEIESLSDITNIENQGNLKTLRLNENKIVDVNLINKLPRNIEIYLDGNNQTITLNKASGNVKLPDLFVEAMNQDSIIYARYGMDITTEGNVKASINGTKVNYTNAKRGDKIIVVINGNPENGFTNNGIKVTYEILTRDDYAENTKLKEKKPLLKLLLNIIDF